MNTFVKSITETYNISQKELASMLGITSAAISQWSSAESISIDMLYKLSRVLPVTVDDLLAGMLPDETSAEKQREAYEWLRDFKIDAAIAMRDEKAVKYFAALKKLKARFFELMFCRVTGKLRDRSEELTYLSTFFTPRTDQKYGDEETFFADLASSGGDKKAIVWELEQYYTFRRQVPFKACFETGDSKLYLAAYDCLDSVSKDEAVTAFRYINYRGLPENVRKEHGSDLPEFLQQVVFAMINRGGQVRYNVGHDHRSIGMAKQKGKEDKLQLMPISVPHVENADETTVLRVLDAWNAAEEILSAVSGRVTNAKAACDRVIRYEEYNKTIDAEEMERIKNAYIAEKEQTAIRDPLKYWQMVKNNQIWVARLI